MLGQGNVAARASQRAEPASGVDESGADDAPAADASLPAADASLPAADASPPAADASLAAQSGSAAHSV